MVWPAAAPFAHTVTKIALPPKGGKAQRLRDMHNKFVQGAQNAKFPLYRLGGVVL